jgi:probable phosphoglycerate mutase
MTRGRRCLVLLRHGHTAWNDSDRAQGHADIPLDVTGRAQAAAVAPCLAKLPLAAVWASDLSRARDTAEPVASACGLTVQSDPRLREYDVGEREGLTLSEAVTRFPDVSGLADLGNPPEGVPGAERYDDVAARVVPAVREGFDSVGVGRVGLVVAHGACLKVAVAGLLGWPASVARTLSVLPNCHMAVIDEWPADRRIRLRSYGVDPISHL